MRRGMMEWQAEEVPAQLLEERVQVVAQQCRDQGLAAMVFYANFTRPGNISALTHFVPFWSQALLAVTAQGKTALVMATTGRTVQWIRSSSVVEHVAVGSQIGHTLADWIAACHGSTEGLTYGVVHPQDIPQPLLNQLASRLGGVPPLDVSAWWDGALAQWDAPESVRAQARLMASTAFKALEGLPVTDAHAMVAVADGRCRAQGAEEVAVYLAPDLARSQHLHRVEGDTPFGARMGVQISVAYKGHWIRQTRSFQQVNGTWVSLPACTAADAAWAATPSLTAPELVQHVAVATGAQVASWSLEGPVQGLPLNQWAGERSGATNHPQVGGSVHMTDISSLTLQLDTAAGPVLWGAALPVSSSSPSKRLDAH